MKASGGTRLVEGTHGSQIHAEVAPGPHDLVVTKCRFGAFSTTALRTLLAARNVTHIVLLGELFSLLSVSSL